MLPLVVGMFSASLISGRLISKTGRYRIFPIMGTLILSIGVWLFSHLGLTTSHVSLSLWMLVIGLGLGQLMQIPTLAVQNSTPREALGTATASVTFFRSIGGALGGAVFGTILTSRFTHHLHELLPQATELAKSGLQAGTSQLQHAPAVVRHDVLLAFVRSFHDMFLLAMPFTIAAFVVALLLREAPLRSSTREMVEAENLEEQTA
jgi:MFS family permease